jgi:hypothetical protein
VRRESFEVGREIYIYSRGGANPEGSGASHSDLRCIISLQFAPAMSL